MRAEYCALVWLLHQLLVCPPAYRTVSLTGQKRLKRPSDYTSFTRTWSPPSLLPLFRMHATTTPPLICTHCGWSTVTSCLHHLYLPHVSRSYAGPSSRRAQATLGLPTTAGRSQSRLHDGRNASTCQCRGTFGGLSAPRPGRQGGASGRGSCA